MRGGQCALFGYVQIPSLNSETKREMGNGEKKYENWGLSLRLKPPITHQNHQNKSVYKRCHEVLCSIGKSVCFLLILISSWIFAHYCILPLSFIPPSGREEK